MFIKENKTFINKKVPVYTELTVKPELLAE
jgi:hypothetical protein